MHYSFPTNQEFWFRLCVCLQEKPWLHPLKDFRLVLQRLSKEVSFLTRLRWYGNRHGLLCLCSVPIFERIVGSVLWESRFLTDPKLLLMFWCVLPSVNQKSTSLVTSLFGINRHNSFYVLLQCKWKKGDYSKNCVSETLYELRVRDRELYCKLFRK